MSTPALQVFVHSSLHAAGFTATCCEHDDNAQQNSTPYIPELSEAARRNDMQKTCRDKTRAVSLNPLTAYCTLARHRPHWQWQFCPARPPSLSPRISQLEVPYKRPARNNVINALPISPSVAMPQSRAAAQCRSYVNDRKKNCALHPE